MCILFQEQSGLVMIYETSREQRYVLRPEALQTVTTWIEEIEVHWNHRLAALWSYLLDEPSTQST